MSLTQEDKLSLRLRQVLSESGLHEIRVYVTPDKVVQFWVVNNGKVEGLTQVPQEEKSVVNSEKSGLTPV
jgi:hypothetical protein